jgi:penicillin-binding protein 1A
VTLTQAIQRSINIIPVKLSIAIGNGNAKVGRAKIVQTARAMGVRSPLPDTPSLPIGADEVNVLDHTAAYATFPNAGKAVERHAILEVRTGNGELVWRFDRDGKKPHQVIPQSVALDMNKMLNTAAEEGTGRRAALEGIHIAGKTGTTNAYRDAWFVGFTGNFVCGVWFGNDDYAPTNRMTGGSLPAMTWKQIMTYAHQGIELKTIPGVAPPTAQPLVVENRPDLPPRPVSLTRRGTEILVRMEKMMEEASHALAASPPAAKSTSQAIPATQTEAVAAAAESANRRVRN